MKSATSKTPKPSSPGRPKDLGKRAAILEAAKRMFTAHGFERVSMDQIAAEAGVSKLTVYSHFGDKETLFSAAITAKCDQLLGIGRGFLTLINSEESLAIHRVVTTQPPPTKLGQLFWEAGPRRMQEAFGSFLRDQIVAGALDIPDVRRAASQFFCLLKGEAHMLLLCGCISELGAAEAEAHVQATVDMFLRAYQATPARKR
jgi:TetR/AcrR family transcriptional repressor of mexJK operon